jgi:uncharacterized RDD family membrane protein YckC
MASYRVETAQNVFVDYTLATAGDRILATLIDFAVIGGYLLAVSFIIGLMGLGFRENGSNTYIIILMLLWLPACFYSLLSEILLQGQSIGKRALKTRVIRMDGSQPTLGNYTARWMFRIVDLFLASGAPALISVLVTENSQRIGDMAAGTLVIKTRRRVTLQEVLYNPLLEKEYKPVFNQIGRLTDSQMGLIREVLQTFYKNKNEMPVEALGEKLKSLLAINTPMNNRMFLETLIRDYAHFREPGLFMGRRKY